MVKSLLESISLKLFIVQDPNKRAAQWCLQKKKVFYRECVKKSFSYFSHPLKMKYDDWRELLLMRAYSVFMTLKHWNIDINWMDFLSPTTPPPTPPQPKY